MAARPNIVYFGATNTLSMATLQTLVAAGVAIQAVFVGADALAQTSERGLAIERLLPPAPAGELPVSNPYYEPNLLHAAWSAGIRTYALSHSRMDQAGQLLRELQADVCCVSCFPKKLPADLITSLPLGFLNVHPSLLPYYRGPAPLFWLFQRDDPRPRGVTIHQMDAGLDTGPLICQEPLVFPDGRSQWEIERDCGVLGGKLLLQAIESLASGDEPHPQPPGGSYYPWPEAADFTLNVRWSARRAFNFMRASDRWRQTYPVTIDGKEVRLAEALDFQPYARQSAPLIVEDQIARIQFNRGTVTARISTLG